MFAQHKDNILCFDTPCSIIGLRSIMKILNYCQSNTVFLYNTAESGGALYGEGDEVSKYFLVVENSRFHKNSAFSKQMQFAGISYGG